MMSIPYENPPNEGYEQGSASPFEVHESARRVLKTPMPDGPDGLDRGLTCGALRTQDRVGLAQNAQLLYQAATDGEGVKLNRILKELNGCRIRQQKQYDKTESKLNNTDPTVRINEDAPPLNRFEYIMVIAIAIVCFGIMTVAFVAMPSYVLSVIDSLPLAYTTGFIGLGLPVSLHARTKTLKPEAAHDRYLATICTVATISVVGWIAMSAFTYGGLVFDAEAELPSRAVGITLLLLSMIAEGTSTAAGVLGIEHILSHRLTKATNPEHTELSKQLSAEGKPLALTIGFIAAIEARLAKYKAAERVYVARTLAVYDQLNFPGDDDFLAGFVKPPSGPRAALP